MSKDLLGEEFDVHGGGLDLVFPHHENEVAQSEALTGKKPVKYWIHNGMVTLKGDKMAKSTGNFFLLKDLLQQFNPMVLRMYLLSSGYRQVLDFSFEGIDNTRKAYDKLVEFKKEIQSLDSSAVEAAEALQMKEVVKPLYDDFNTPRAIGEVFKKLTPIKENIFKGIQAEEDIKTGKKLIYIIEEVIGINLDLGADVDVEKIESLIALRNQARKQKNFSEADRIRDELNKMDVELKDTPTGTRWQKRKNQPIV
jgi:cysteinyl-tRNA synthetase